MEQNTLKGYIVSEKRGLFACASDEGGQYACRAATRFRNQNNAPVVGDRIDFTDNGDGTGFITVISERKNCFLRPHIANVDLLVIVVTPADPAPDLYVIDKLSCVAIRGGAKPVFVVNKNDVGDGNSLAEIYRRCGFDVFMTRADIAQGVDGLKAYISGKTSVFCGASGVGKSSLLNAICPAARAETGDISHRIGRGRNTTRHTELFPLDCGGRIADSPGFSLLDIGEALNVPCDELPELFPEFEEYRYSCRYRSCTHTKDDGCAVRHAVSDGIIPQSRHESYVRLYNELKNTKRYQL